MPRSAVLANGFLAWQTCVATKDADAVAILTDRNCFRALDYVRVFAEMRQPAFLFDGRNCVDHAALYALGFNVYAVGKPARSHQV